MEPVDAEAYTGCIPSRLRAELQPIRCTCVSVSPCLCVCVCAYLTLSVYVCLCLPVSVCVRVCVYVCGQIRVSVCLSACLAACLSVCLSVGARAAHTITKLIHKHTIKQAKKRDLQSQFPEKCWSGPQNHAKRAKTKWQFAKTYEGRKS